MQVTFSHGVTHHIHTAQLLWTIWGSLPCPMTLLHADWRRQGSNLPSDWWTTHIHPRFSDANHTFNKETKETCGKFWKVWFFKKPFKWSREEECRVDPVDWQIHEFGERGAHISKALFPLVRKPTDTSLHLAFVCNWNEFNWHLNVNVLIWQDSEVRESLSFWCVCDVEHDALQLLHWQRERSQFLRVF